MMTFGGMIRTGAAAALLLVGLATGPQAFSGAGGVATGIGGGRQALRITGKIVCIGCDLEEARKAHPTLSHLYQFTSKTGQVVMAVNAVNDSMRWGALTWPPRVWVRAEDALLQRMTAEGHVAREIAITGLLSSSRTLDVFDIDVRG